MKRIFLLVAIVCILCLPLNTLAHPGRLDGKGCHTCKTNCASWGLVDYEYHCHSGDTYTNSKGQTFNKDGVKISDPVINNPESEPTPTPQPEPAPEPEPNPSISNDATSNNNSNNNTSSNTNNNTKPSTNSGNNSGSSSNTSTSTNEPSTNTSV